MCCINKKWLRHLMNVKICVQNWTTGAESLISIASKFQFLGRRNLWGSIWPPPLDVHGLKLVQIKIIQSGSTNCGNKWESSGKLQFGKEGTGEENICASCQKTFFAVFTELPMLGWGGEWSLSYPLHPLSGKRTAQLSYVGLNNLQKETIISLLYSSCLRCSA